jgi:DNA-binding response OmpR family regulator
MYGNRIILVSSDPDITLICQKAFEKENITIQTILDPEDVPDILSEGFQGVLILDSSLDEDDLPGLCGFISDSLKVPVIVIGRKELTERRVEYLDSGADVCLELPVNTDELLAQVKALRRRVVSGELHPDKAEFASGDLRIDYHRRLVTVKGKEVALTHKEYGLLTELTKNAGTILSYRHLLHTIWGNVYTDERQYVHRHICRLKKKIETDPRNPVYIPFIRRVTFSE